MRAVDTNLIVRIFSEDDSQQADIAYRVLATDSVGIKPPVVAP